MRLLWLLVLVMILIVPRDAHAYLDPATGSLILQGILAGIFGAALTAKLYWKRLKALFGASKVPENTEEHALSAERESLGVEPATGIHGNATGTSERQPEGKDRRPDT